MKKILLIGCLNKNLGGIKECIEDDYLVQFCPANTDIIKDMICLVKPDLIIVSQIDLVDEDIPVFALLEKRYLRTPVLIVALRAQEDHFNNFLKADRKTMVLYRPMTKSRILAVCKELLKNGTYVSYNDSLQNLLAKDSPKSVEISEKTIEEENPIGEDSPISEENPIGEDSPISEENPISEEKPITLQAPVNAPKHILVVDDNLLILRNVRRLLEDRYLVSISRSGEQALSLMEEIKVDLVLLDYEMPGWDGKKTLEVMRMNEKLANIPVVFLTGISEKDHIMSVLRLNPAGYLLKPITKEKLIETIEAKL